MVYGGRNDTLYDSMGDSVIGMIDILNLTYLAWSPVRTGRNILRSYNFSACSKGTSPRSYC